MNGSLQLASVSRMREMKRDPVTPMYEIVEDLGHGFSPPVVALGTEVERLIVEAQAQPLKRTYRAATFDVQVNSIGRDLPKLEARYRVCPVFGVPGLPFGSFGVAMAMSLPSLLAWISWRFEAWMPAAAAAF